MRLTEEEYYQYLSIHPKLIYYIGKKKKIIPAATTLEEFMEYSAEETIPPRDAVYDNIDLFDDFINDYSDELSEEDKTIVREFKNFRKGAFTVFKLTSKYAHFSGEGYVYAVHALNDPFQWLLGDDLPAMVQAVLLPFKGKIIYDGLLMTYPVRLGSGIRSSLKNDYNLSIGKYGIITTLPEQVVVDNSIKRVEKELLIMMKTKASCEYNWYDIQDLLENYPELEPTYFKEWGRINSRKKKKEIRELEIKKRWFAIYDDTILASGVSEKAVKGEINTMIEDPEKRKGIFYFKV